MVQPQNGYKTVFNTRGLNIDTSRPIMEHLEEIGRSEQGKFSILIVPRGVICENERGERFVWDGESRKEDLSAEEQAYVEYRLERHAQTPDDPYPPKILEIPTPFGEALLPVAFWEGGDDAIA